VLVLVGVWPRSTLLGDNILRLPPASIARNEIAITIDDGPDPDVTLQVLDILDRYDVKASFFVTGRRAARNPNLIRDMVTRGHSVENHTEKHSNWFAFYPPRKLHDEIKTAQHNIAHLAGRAPLFFRPPAGVRTLFLDPILFRCGLRLVDWTRRGFDTVSTDLQSILLRLTRRLCAGDILLLHDGHSARDNSGQAVILSVLPALLQHIHAMGLNPVTLPEAVLNADTVASQSTIMPSEHR